MIFSLWLRFLKVLSSTLNNSRGDIIRRLPAHMQVTSAFPSSCSKPPSSRWDRELGYPTPNTGKPPMPPATGERSSVGAEPLTVRLTERLDTSASTDAGWRHKTNTNRVLFTADDIRSESVFISGSF